MSDGPTGQGPQDPQGPPPTPPFAAMPPAPTPTPTPEPTTSPGSAGRSRGKPIVAALVVAIVVVVAVVVVRQTSKPSGPPSAPGNVAAKGTICTPPDCNVLTGTVTVTWTAPTTGSPVTGYDIYRGLLKITSKTLGPAVTSYEDPDVGLGIDLTYQVLAHSADGDSKRSETASATMPLPPARFAQLSGVFAVRLTVQRASNLGKAQGIEHPVPGDTTTQTWVFQPKCPTNTGPCPVSFLAFKGLVLRENGRAYDGTGHGIPATCLPSGTTPSNVSFHLVPTQARMKGPNWDYTAFTGTTQLSFSCPGSLASSATFTVTARVGKIPPSSTSGA